MKGLLQDYTSRRESRTLINLAPLIDVIFQLILFFMVTSSFTWFSGMKVQLPEASAAVVELPLETITLEIARGTVVELGQPERLTVRWWEEGITGEILWPLEEGVDPTSLLLELRTKLDEYKKTLTPDRKPSVVIAAEDSVPYQSVVTVIDMCEQLNLTDIVLAIQRNTLATPEGTTSQ